MSSRKLGEGDVILGIDLGTTTVKACLIVASNREVIESRSQETKASVPSDYGSTGSEQDVHRICTALQFCVSRFPKDILAKVGRVAFSGQMHGCVLWRANEGWQRNKHGRYDVNKVSSLYTWQDGRCSPEFLATLPRPKSHLRLSTGYGCATLLWLVQKRPPMAKTYDRAGTVQDLVVAMLCALDRPVMSVQNAASWGYYDTVSSSWNSTSLQEAGLPLEWLPEVVSAGVIAGHTENNWYGVPQGVPVYAALGDLQCSVYSTLEKDSDAAVNISTSAQISFAMPEGFVPPEDVDQTSPIEYFPYFEGRYMAVAASLNGGNVLAAFVKMLQQWTHELGLGVPESKIWERIISLANEESATGEQNDNLMEIVPTLFGERHLPDQRASAAQIEKSSLSLGRVSRSICKGLISNLYSMMTKEVLLEAGVERIVGSGAALVRNPILKEELERFYSLPVIYGAKSDAAIGAALSVLNQ